MGLIRSQLASALQMLAFMKTDAYDHGIEHMPKETVGSCAAYRGVACLGGSECIRGSGVEPLVLLLNNLDIYSVWAALSLGVSFTAMDEPLICTLAQEAADQQRIAKVHLT